MRLVALYDTHIGFEDGTPTHINLTPIFRFIHDFKPTHIVLGGDMHDFTCASHWIADQSTRLEGQSIWQSFQELKEYLLDPLKSAMPRGCEVKYLTGNHEDWLVQTLMLNRNGFRYWRIEDNIDFKKYNMELIPLNKAYVVNDHLCYIHGLYTTMFHAKKTVETYHSSIFYGHTHDIQTHVLVSPIDQEHFYKGASVGCLCYKSPSYTKNRPNRWVNGFHYNYIDENTGYFHDSQVVLVKGGFWANGKYYS